MMQRTLLMLIGVMLGATQWAEAQRTYDCGNLGQRVCKWTDWERYNMRWGDHKCDADLEERDGRCVNKTRMTRDRETGWLGWVLNEQLYGISRNQPINRIAWLGAHNAFSNYQQGFGNPVYTNHFYSVTDQLNMGVRHLELDPHFYGVADPVDREVRLCHSGQAAVCLVPGYGTRLFGFLLREIGQWLKANPDEVIILKLNEKNIDAFSGAGVGEMYSLLERYLGEMAYRPIVGYTRWPTVAEIRGARKQVVIMEHDQEVQGAGQQLVWGASSLIQSSNWPKNQNFDTCVSNDGVQQKDRAARKWWDVAEGRSLSNTPPIDDETGLLDEGVVRKAVNCGASILGMDYLRALNWAPLGNRQNVPDRRIEATIWSYAENDMGTGGPAAMIPEEGSRWKSMAEGLAKHYACARKRLNGDPNDVRDWKITAAKGAWNVPLGNVMCATEFGSDFEFAHPQNGYQNRDLWSLAAGRVTAAGLWMAYSTQPRGLAATSQNEVTFSMAPGGAIAEPQVVQFYALPLTQAVAEVRVPWLRVVGLESPVTVPSSGMLPARFTLTPAAQSMAPGAYPTTVVLQSIYSVGGVRATVAINVNVTLVIQRAVGFTLTAAESTVPYNGRVRLKAVFPLLEPKVSGTVTFVRTSAVDPSGTALTVGLAGQEGTGDVNGLAPGRHRFAATYSGDTNYQPGDSSEVEVEVLPRIAVTPAAVALTMDFGGAVPSGVTLNVAGANGTLSATRPCGWLTATVAGLTQVNVGLVANQVQVLAPGTYRCDITLSDNLAATLGTQVVPVTLTIRTTLSANLTAVQFVSSGGTQSREVFVTTPGNKTVDLTATSNQEWLSVFVPLNQTPTNVVVAATPRGLAPGTYTARITLRSSAAVNPLFVDVTLQVVTESVVTSSPVGLRVVVDGAPQTTPAYFTWAPGSAHAITTDTFQQPDAGLGIRYRFTGWQQGGAQTQSVTAGFAGATYVGNFVPEYLLSVSALPSAGGTVTRNPVGDGSGFYPVNTPVQLTATANPGYFFGGFTGEVFGSQPTVTAVMDKPKGTVVQFPQQAALEFTVDSNVAATILVNGSPVVVPGKVLLAPGVTYTIGAPAEVAGAAANTRWVFAAWPGIAATPTFSYTAPAAAGVLTLRYQQQYLVAATASPATGGTVTGGGWIDAGRPVTLQATANAGFGFAGFSGGGLTSAAGNPATIATVTGPLAVVANFTATGTPTLFAASSGARTDGPGAGQRSVPIAIRNAGSGAAADAAITSVVNVVVVSGSGAVTLVSAMPVALGTIAPGGQSLQTLVFDWPATATRVQMTVKFAANNGAYQGSTTLNLIR